MFSFLSRKNNESVDDDIEVVMTKRKEPERIYPKAPDAFIRNDIGEDELPLKCADYHQTSGCDSSVQPCVIDVSSSMMKCGFGGDDAPRACFPTICGSLKNPEIFVGACDFRDYYVGDEAQAKRGILNLRYPIEFGRPKDWDDFEKIFKHTLYHELRVTPEEHPMFITEPANSDETDRSRLTKLMFETFNVPALYVGSRPVCSIFASGRTTGLCVGVGSTQSTATPIYEGLVLSHCCLRTEIGGRDITDYLVKLLSQRGYEMTTSAEREIVRDIKEKLGYVCEWKLEEEMESPRAKQKVEYVLPDGTKMQIGPERFRCCEILFEPKLIEKDFLGFDQMIYDSIQNCDVDIRKDLYQNIVLWGGSTMFEGIVERVSLDVQQLGPKHSRIKVNAPAERKFSSWIGASIQSSLSNFSDKWITKDEYDDLGESIVNRKCL